MRAFPALLISALLLPSLAPAQTAPPACTGLCLQQVNTCSGNGTTSITGTVYAPNGIDPLPNVTVYIPNAPVDPFTPGVSCPIVGAPPSGSPLVGTTSAVDGTFELDNVPVGVNIPLVIVSGRWRRQLTISNVAACTNQALPASFVTFPQNQTQGDIPKIAIATGSVDQVECVLRKVGIADSEFTNPGGSGRINLYSGSNSPGALIDTTTPSQTALMSSAATLNSYDVLMLPCQGGQYIQPALQLNNFLQFANDGGRVYSSHFSYVWMYNNPPFNGVANWNVNNGSYSDGTATVNTNFTAGQTLANWLQLTGASTSLGQMPITTLKHDLNGVIAPTQSWLTLNTTGNPVMQFVFDAPIPPAGTVVNQCGRVLYNEYHVENPPAGSSPKAVVFPNECASTATVFSPQEKLLEYMLFELTDDGGQPSLSPGSAAFGNQAVTFTSAPQTFTWTNNSSFTSQVTSAVATGPFSVSSNNCSLVAPGASCMINVVFTPPTLGPFTGSLKVVSSGNTLSAALTGTGVPALSFSTTSLAYGNQDVGFSATQSFTVTSSAPQALPLPQLLVTGDYAVVNGCGSTVAALATCTINVVFTPATTGPRPGTLSVNSSAIVYSGLTLAMTGNGIDFTLALNPTSGSVIAGDSVSSTATFTPLAGFANAIVLSCATSAAGAGCSAANASFTPTAVLTTAVSITTTSKYTVIGYGGLGGGGYLWLVGLATGLLLWKTRRKMGPIVRATLVVLLLAAASFSTTGCTGKLPTQNPVFTAPGSYVITVKATDGFLVHTATYTLAVSAQ